MTEKNPPLLRWSAATMLNILRHPKRFFGDLSWTEIPINRALVLGFACLCVGLGSAALSDIFFAQFSLKVLATNPDAFAQLEHLLTLPEGQNTVAAISERLHSFMNEKWLVIWGLPLLAYFSLYLLAGSLWFFCRFSLLYHKEYDTILKLVALAQVSLIFAWVPLLGPFLTTTWMIFLLMQGINTIHPSSTFQRLITVLCATFIVRSLLNFALTLLAAVVF